MLMISSNEELTKYINRLQPICVHAICLAHGKEGSDFKLCYLPIKLRSVPHNSE